MEESGRGILLIEDSPMDVDLTRRALARTRPAVSIEVARDGEEAMACIKHWEAGGMVPALILLDLNLPKVKGLDVLYRIKRHPRFSTIPVVVLTTSHESHDLHTAYQFGANSYILKPVDYDRFLRVAEEIKTYWYTLNVQPL